MKSELKGDTTQRRIMGVSGWSIGVLVQVRVCLRVLMKTKKEKKKTPNLKSWIFGDEFEKSNMERGKIPNPFYLVGTKVVGSQNINLTVRN